MSRRVVGIWTQDYRGKGQVEGNPQRSRKITTTMALGIFSWLIWVIVHMMTQRHSKICHPRSIKSCPNRFAVIIFFENWWSGFKRKLSSAVINNRTYCMDCVQKQEAVRGWGQWGSHWTQPIKSPNMGWTVMALLIRRAPPELDLSMEASWRFSWGKLTGRVWIGRKRKDKNI